MPFFVGGVGLQIRWLIYNIWYYDIDRSRVPSLVLAAILIGIGCLLLVLGVICHLLSINRRLLEDVQYRARALDVQSRPPSPLVYLAGQANPDGPATEST